MARLRSLFPVGTDIRLRRLTPFEEQHTERRQRKQDGMLTAMTRHRFAPYLAAVPHVASAIQRRVTIEQLDVTSFLADPHTVAQSRYRCEIVHTHDRVSGIDSFPLKQNDAARTILKVNPIETRVVEINLVKRGLRSMDPVEIFDPAHDPLMRLILCQMPVEALVVIPFIPLAKIHAHEQ